ncbi:MAG: hypothetical protein JWO32_3071 [Bacteroidetes bacterium]|nr:hypothetical protein [Bacteroidota bacterium]
MPLKIITNEGQVIWINPTNKKTEFVLPSQTKTITADKNFYVNEKNGFVKN